MKIERGSSNRACVSTAELSVLQKVVCYIVTLLTQFLPHQRHSNQTNHAYPTRAKELLLTFLLELIHDQEAILIPEGMFNDLR